MTEILAICEAMFMGVPVKQSNIIVESDSQIVINSITGKIKDDSLIVHLVEDIITLVTGFKNVRFPI